MLVLQASARHDIRDYGALANVDSYKAEKLNSAALISAIAAANATQNMDEREVYVPANMTFNTMPV